MWKRAKDPGLDREAVVRGYLTITDRERGAMLAGLVFVRSISNVYVKETFRNEDRFVLASRAAKIGAKLVHYKRGLNRLYLFQQCHEVVQAFLDHQSGEKDDNVLELASEWFSRV